MSPRNIGAYGAGLRRGEVTARKADEIDVLRMLRLIAEPG